MTKEQKVNDSYILKQQTTGSSKYVVESDTKINEREREQCEKKSKI